VVGFRYVLSQMAFDRDERALSLVISSDLAPMRLTPAATGLPAYDVYRESAAA